MSKLNYDYYDSEQHLSWFKEGYLSIDGIQKAYENQDVNLAGYICIAVLVDLAPIEMFRAAQEGSNTFLNLHQQIQKNVAAENKANPTTSINKLKENIWRGHQQVWEDLTSDAKKEWLPNRVLIAEVIDQLWNDDSVYAREQLLVVLRNIAFAYGPWKVLKKIFKEAEEQMDWEVYAIMATRLSDKYSYSRRSGSSALTPSWVDDGSDTSDVNGDQFDGDYALNDHSRSDVSKKTQDYLSRRISRTMRRLASDHPEGFLTVALEMLMHTKDQEELELLSTYRQGIVQALVGDYEHLWSENYDALLNLLEHTNAGEEAFALLVDNFGTEFGKVDGEWLLRLAKSHNAEFAYRWIREECAVGSGEMHEYGYHQTILRFLGYEGQKWSKDAQQYALQYLRNESLKEASQAIIDHFDLNRVLWMLRHNSKDFRDIGLFLLFGVEGKSPYADVLTVEIYTELLEDPNTFTLVEKIFRDSMTKADLSADWYAQRLQSPQAKVRQMALDFLKDSTKFKADDNWSQCWKGILSSFECTNDIYTQASKNILRKNSEGQSLLDDRAIFTWDWVRSLMMHPNAIVHNEVLRWFSAGILTLKELGVDFMKGLVSVKEMMDTDWSIVLGAEFTKELSNHLIVHEDQAYNQSVGRQIRVWLKNEFTMSEIGNEWIYNRLENWSSDYAFAREIFLRDSSFATLAELDGKESSTEVGAKVALRKIISGRDANSPRANLYKKLVLERISAYRKHQGLLPVQLKDENQIFPVSVFDFAKFSSWASNKKEPIRQFAMTIAKYEMVNWAKTLDFDAVQDLLNTDKSYNDVVSFMTNAVFAPIDPMESSKMDIEGNASFTAAKLYPYCFSTNKNLRQFAMRVIATYPTKFGQPNDLFNLADSKDPRVRQLVIQVVWTLFGTSTVTADWKPFKYSVAPYDVSALNDTTRHVGTDPNTLGIKPEDVKSTEKYVGLGTNKTPERSLNETNKMQLKQFLTQVLFSLPTKPTILVIPGRPVEEAVPLTASWKNKKTLIEAIRDVALNDSIFGSSADAQNFAQFVLPILQEFKHIRGKMLRNTCLTALTQIDNKYPELKAFGEK